MTVIRPDKSVDSLATDNQVRTWSSAHAVLTFLHGTCDNTWILKSGEQWQRGKVIDALACYC
ncbi:MAG TPA: hypothetical protein VJ571_09485 [Candidatus Nitrosotalea sp.]|nr:hypothetical protein [Candidatus Nitrosotalea sp.]